MAKKLLSIPKSFKIVKPNQSTRLIATKALRLAKANKPELRALDTTVFATTVTDSWVVARMSCPAQGLTDQAREGNVVMSKSIQLLGNMNVNSNATHSKVRILIVKDKQNDGVAPVVAEVLESDTINAFFGFLAGTRKRFTILYDRTFVMVPTAGNSLHHIQKFIRLGNEKQLFRGTANADASCAKNSLWFMICGNEVTNDPSASITSRYVFTDV